MNDAQIKHMVDRFLGWKLPKNFKPDNGISVEWFANKGTPREFRRIPVGTNLLDATQADAMVRYMLEGLPTGAGNSDLNGPFIISQLSSIITPPDCEKGSVVCRASYHKIENWGLFELMGILPSNRPTGASRVQASSHDPLFARRDLPPHRASMSSCRSAAP